MEDNGVSDNFAIKIELNVYYTTTSKNDVEDLFFNKVTFKFIII